MYIYVLTHTQIYVCVCMCVHMYGGRCVLTFSQELRLVLPVCVLWLGDIYGRVIARRTHFTWLFMWLFATVDQTSGEGGTGVFFSRRQRFTQQFLVISAEYFCKLIM